MLVIVFVALLSEVSPGYCGVASTWENFWSVSCEFSTIVSRNRRSIEEPNFEDPEQFFQYLYPLADMKPEHSMNNTEERSSRQNPHSLSSWFDDIVDLWQSECHDRHKRSVTSRRQGEESMSMYGYGGNSSSLSLKDEEHNYDGDESGNPGSSYSSHKKKQSTSTQEKEKMEKIHSREEDQQYFTSYGGDIEYFFPLLGFGIPFDSEITLLGFHGFKGIFPYRR